MQKNILPLKLDIFHDNYETDILMTCLTVCDEKLTSDEVMNLYKHTKTNYIDYKDNDTLKYIITKRYNDLGNHILIPLNNSFEAINADIGYTFASLSYYDNLIDKFFEYNEYLKDYGYRVNGNKLIYENCFGNTFAIGFNSYLEELNEKIYYLNY